MDEQSFRSYAKNAGLDPDMVDQYIASKKQQSQPQTTDWKTFVQTAVPIAQQEDFPLSVLLGQAALESGRGSAAPGNNFFGIKGTGSAGSNNLSTSEYGPNGYYQTNSDFAAYNSPADSIRAYINLIKNNYPTAYALRTNPDAMIKAIKSYGYATSPNYVQEVEATPEFQVLENQ